MAFNVSDVWQFKKDDNGRWHWQRQSLHHQILQEGGAAFACFDECVDDAKRFGYTGSASITDETHRGAKRRSLRSAGRYKAPVEKQ